MRSSTLHLQIKCPNTLFAGNKLISLKSIRHGPALSPNKRRPCPVKQLPAKCLTHDLPLALLRNAKGYKVVARLVPIRTEVSWPMWKNHTICSTKPVCMTISKENSSVLYFQCVTQGTVPKTQSNTLDFIANVI